MTGVFGQSGVADQRGSITAWLMVVPLLVLLLGGLSVDLWAALAARGRIAAIADEAAAAGATALSEDDSRAVDQQVRLDPAEAQRRALEAVDTHPAIADVTARSATASAELVSVTVEGVSDFLFLRLVGATTVPIRVTGHASATPAGP
ncbi:MAG: pilus assembly protein TadG-related protein [Euzebya sp.]